MLCPGVCIQQLHYALCEQKQDTATLDMERANKEIEVLRKQCEAMSQELKEAVQEAEVAKCRRDWAFQERDKIVAERESIRYTCHCINTSYMVNALFFNTNEIIPVCLIGLHGLSLIAALFYALCGRTLCDNLRRERDRAVSDLADALRNLDDMRKQKNDAVRELKELK